MPSYAKNTSVPVGRSRTEIELLLKRHGADAFAYVEEGGRVMIGFRIRSRSVRMELPLPGYEDDSIRLTATGTLRGEKQQAVEFDREVRRRWRALAMVLKAKLIAVEDGISTIEREFLADIVLADGRTMIEAMRPQLQAGPVRPLLPPYAEAPHA